MRGFAAIPEDEQAELPGMRGFNPDDEEAHAARVAAAAEAAERDELGKAQRRRSSLGLSGQSRRASWDITQTILQEKRVLSSTAVVSEEDLAAFIETLTDAGDNDEKATLVEGFVEGKYFSCAQIVAICDTTPSLKTKHAFLALLIPRCTDPNEGGASITGMFRFTADKGIAADALKIRASALKVGMQMVMAPTGTFSSGAGTAAAAMSIAGVTQSSGRARRGSLGSGAEGTAVKRDEHGMIANPLLRRPQAKQVDV
jgi:hypothetical protein